ncbi:hypothetical protein BJ138DRAFT_1003835 [Hygrophoropsis aurantiaca]|uniref:Uncharacterized protein n=1 Tax=Hygrophoropsis aurantiaca TaxID=72124 RepID=A0ACB8AJ06_9AGAM|nr:hypothetical protein BJ138DRAFT_1003835 [Hygrophoropsis aurantiaca]
MSLHTLPYDLLFNIAQYLDVDDIHSIQACCKSLRLFTLTRPVYRALAHTLLLRSRPLPLPAFARLPDLQTPDLIRAVNRAHSFDRAWRVRPPRPASKNWYTIISAPPGEEIDWLSPITSSYTLCATKSGKVVCWDVERDLCLAEWDPRQLELKPTEKGTPGREWELWKCRVEFDEKAVYFTMARVIKKLYDDNRVMEFVLMKLAFPPEDPIPPPTSAMSPIPNPPAVPHFFPLTTFHTRGVVMNVFLLDPPRRLLSAFVWVASSNTIGLYVLLDWDKDEYVFIDTGVECLISSNWSCILHDDQIVIHSEETDAAFQHFYPLDMLRKFIRPRRNTEPSKGHRRRSSESTGGLPTIIAALSPVKSISKKFVFPPSATAGSVPNATAETVAASSSGVDPPSILPSEPPIPPNTSAPVPTPEPNPNPYPFPPWYPESAHFVRQWWPTLHGVPRLSCTVVLLAAHDPDTHRTRFVLAQHYFRVPIVRDEPVSILTGSTSETADASPGGRSSTSKADDDEMLHLWYVSTPFEVVCVLDGPADTDDDEEEGGDRPRPLVAVDFGHAVWIEYQGDPDPQRHRVPKCLRFVTFPPVGGNSGGTRQAAIVRTLEVPEELDLNTVETINIDQSQGAVILSVKEGKIFILRYE